MALGLLTFSDQHGKQFSTALKENPKAGTLIVGDMKCRRLELISGFLTIFL